MGLNWWAIIVCVILNMAIGAGWYGVWAKPWMAGIGKSREEIEANPQMAPYGVAVLNSVLMALVLAVVISWAGVATLLGGLGVGALMWLGFVGLAFGSNHAFEGRSLQLWAINSGTYLVGLLLMGAILGVWQ